MKKLKVLAVLMAILMTTNVHAALQSRPGGTRKSAMYNSLFKLIREMEATGGSLGLNAILEEDVNTRAYIETSESNNIDTHMCKNTEWGTVAMLSASKYGAGNGNVTPNSDTSTGNMTGVYGLHEGYEIVAGGIVSLMANIMKNAPIRYVDSYEEGTDGHDLTRYITGDATYETRTFSGATQGYFVTNGTKYIFYRGRNGNINRYPGIFEFGTSTNSGRGRLVVWVGEGI